MQDRTCILIRMLKRRLTHICFDWPLLREKRLGTTSERSWGKNGIKGGQVKGEHINDDVSTWMPGPTLLMASAMASTMPPTSPTSLAASFRVTMMSSTASFMSWAASVMASWVCWAWEGTGERIARSFHMQKKMVLSLLRITSLLLSVTLKRHNTKPYLHDGA